MTAPKGMELPSQYQSFRIPSRRILNKLQPLPAGSVGTVKDLL